MISSKYIVPIIRALESCGWLSHRELRDILGVETGGSEKTALQALHREGLLESQREGAWIFYRLVSDWRARFPQVSDMVNQAIKFRTQRQADAEQREKCLHAKV